MFHFKHSRVKDKRAGCFKKGLESTELNSEFLRRFVFPVSRFFICFFTPSSSSTRSSHGIFWELSDSNALFGILTVTETLFFTSEQFSIFNFSFVLSSPRHNFPRLLGGSGVSTQKDISSVRLSTVHFPPSAPGVLLTRTFSPPFPSFTHDMAEMTFGNRVGLYS